MRVSEGESVRTAAPGDRLLLVLLIVLIVGVPTIFLRTTFTTFEIGRAHV